MDLFIQDGRVIMKLGGGEVLLKGLNRIEADGVVEKRPIV